MTEVVLGAVMNAVMKLIKLGWNSDENLKELEQLLELIKPYVREAERNSTSKAVKIWLHELKTKASLAREILDDIAEEEHDRIANNLLCACLCFKISSSAHRLKMASKIEDIKESLKKIVEVGTSLALQSNIKLSGPESSSSSSVQETKPYLDDPELVANREVDVSIVVNMLIGASNSSHALPVVSIVGMAGLGKTTLAKMVLRDDRLKSVLETRQRLWVCVSNTFDVKKILCQILESLSGQPAASFESLSESTIVDKIKKELKERSFILVLDDVWNKNTEKWKDLMDCLLEIIDQKNKSIILATTRDEEVASTMRSQESMHRISKLEDDQCWSIIKAKSFGKFSVVPEDLEFIGRDIAGKCKGVALVASVVGGTMQKKRTKDEWSSIQNSDLWSSLQSNEEILKILRLSYDRLGSRDLQMCFAFCSIFPEDDILYKDKLIQLWMAAGFLQASPANYCPTAWDTGSKYFGELVSNSLFQDVEEDIYGYIQTCKMHDLVHCLARSLSEAMVLTSGTNSFIGVSSILHLNIIGGQREIATMLERDDAPKLQSLFANIDVFCHMPKKCRRLRALKLNDGDTNKLPESIGELKALRYFDISFTQVEKLPGSFIKLKHLQTLNVECCWNLKQLPKGMENLVELSHFYFDKEELMPSNIGRLTCLQTLPLFFVGAEKGRLIEELGSLSHLRGRLRICNLELVRDEDEAKMAKLHEKKGIYKLELEWNEERVPLENGVVEGLEPHSELRDLCIRNYKGNSFPSWLSFTSVHSSQCPLPNLTKLMLLSCTNCVKLPSLGDLPKLTYLDVDNLRAVKSIGTDFYGNAKFPALKEFVLSRMESLEEWVGAIERKSFPLLEKLRIKCCSNLRSMPSINDLPHLKELNISNLKLSLMDLEAGFSSLEKLELSDCVELESISLKNGLPCLQDIDISDCCKLISIEDGLSSCKCLRKIRITSCENLKFLPRFHELCSLEYLKLLGNMELCVPRGLECCSSLQVLTVAQCYNMSWGLDDLERLATLSYFRVSGNISWGVLR